MRSPEEHPTALAQNADDTGFPCSFHFTIGNSGQLFLPFARPSVTLLGT